MHISTLRISNLFIKIGVGTDKYLEVWVIDIEHPQGKNNKNHSHSHRIVIAELSQSFTSKCEHQLLTIIQVQFPFHEKIHKPIFTLYCE